MKRKKYALIPVLVLLMSVIISCGRSDETMDQVPSTEETVDNDDSTSVLIGEESLKGDDSVDLNRMIDAIVSDKDLSVLIDEEVGDSSILSGRSEEIGNYQCRMNDERRVVSIATIDSGLNIYGNSPQSKVDDVIESLLLDQWSFVAEYLWYSENENVDNAVSCYQSAVYEKDNYEFIITANTENSEEVYAIELIDRNMLNSDMTLDTNSTAFGILHGLS